MIIEKKVFFQP